MLPEETVADRFAVLFAGLERAHGTTNVPRLKLNKAKGKMEGSSFIVKEAPAVGHWERHLAGSYGLGIFPLRDDGTCSWGAIDIDVYDLDHKALEQQVRTLGLPLVITRTKSGGAHLFLFMTAATPAKLVRGRLMDWAIALGYSGVEVFPKQVSLASERDFGNWLNMPYYNGKRTTRYAMSAGKAIIDPVAFLEHARAHRVTAAALKTLVVKQEEVFKDGPPCLQTLAQRGFPDGQRNEALFNCAIYLHKRHGEDWEKKLDEVNARYMRPPLGHREVAKIAGSIGKKAYVYRCNEEPLRHVCNRQICLTRKFGIRGAANDPQISIDGLSRLLTEPPTWIVAVNGERLEMDSETLLNQRKFRVIVLSRLKIVSHFMKQADWDKLIGAKVAEAEDLEAPADASPEGQLLAHLENFCTDSQAMEKEELLNGLPYSDPGDGRTYFRSLDLKHYLETRRAERWSDRQLWVALRRLGAVHRQFHIKGKNVQTWGVQSFSQQNEEFSTPATIEKGDF